MVHFLSHAANVLFRSPLFAVSCAAPLVQLWALGAGRRAFATALSLGTLLFLTLFTQASSVGVYIGAHAIAWLGCVGLAALALILRLALGLGVPPTIARRARFLGAVFLVVISLETLNGRFLRFTGEAFALTWDRPLALLDTRFGLDTAFVTGRFLQRFPAIWNFAFVAYNSLLLGLLSLIAVESRQSYSRALATLLQFVGAGFVGGSLYLLLPVSGPLYAFPAIFPATDPVLGLADLLPASLAAAPRNGVPSLHTAWVVLLYLSARHQRVLVRTVYALLLAGTLLATVGTGEHYLLDLVVAFPLAVGVSLLDPASYRHPRAWLRAGGLVACTVFCVLAIRCAATALYSAPAWTIPAASLLLVSSAFAIRWRWQTHLPKPVAAPADIEIGLHSLRSGAE